MLIFHILMFLSIIHVIQQNFIKMSVDLNKILRENILEEQYYEDVARKTIKFLSA